MSRAAVNVSSEERRPLYCRRMDILDRLLQYDTWIMRRMLVHCQQLTEAQRHERFDIGWETVHATLVHVVANMELWNDLLHGRTPQDDSNSRVPSLNELIARHQAVAEELGALARGQAARGNLDGIMVDTLNDPPTESTCGTVLCDIFHENMVHRSEVRHMLKRLYAPPLEAYDPISWERNREMPVAGSA
jgi:uncharacterized damage-inducible protein DinB